MQDSPTLLTNLCGKLSVYVNEFSSNNKTRPFLIRLSVELLHGVAGRASVPGSHAYGTSATKGNRGCGTGGTIPV